MIKVALANKKKRPFECPGKKLHKQKKEKKKKIGWLDEGRVWSPWVLKCWIYVHTTHGFSVTRSPTRSLPSSLSMSTFSAVPNNIHASFPSSYNLLFPVPSFVTSSVSKFQRSHKKTSPVAFNGVSLPHNKRRTSFQNTTVFGELNSSRFLQMGSQETCSNRQYLIKSTGSESATTSTLSQNVSKRIRYANLKYGVDIFSVVSLIFCLKLLAFSWTPGTWGFASNCFSWDHSGNRQVFEEGICGSSNQVSKCAFRDVLYILNSNCSWCHCPCCGNKLDEFLSACPIVHSEMAAIVLRPIFGCFAAFC